MTSEQLKNKSTFKYNMSFYYQSTIIYFIVFAVYLIIRGQFIDNSYTLVTRDPIIYLLAFIVVVSLLSVIYNLLRNRHIEFDENGLAFIDKSKSKVINKTDIIFIKLSKDRRYQKSNALRFILIKLKNRRRPIIIRPSDYENENELIKRFHQLKMEIES
jgi:hypothetical protein